MRIIGGKYKGLKLNSPDNLKIRPTSDKIKEAIFSIIESQKFSSSIQDKSFLDLCSGSGAMALEAFSRGAKIVYLVEISKTSLNLLSNNIKKLNLIENERDKLIILKGNVLRLKKLGLPQFDFIYIDPPYDKKFSKIILKNLNECKVINNKTLIFFETNKLLDDCPEEYKILSIKKYRETYINIIKLKAKFS